MLLHQPQTVQVYTKNGSGNYGIYSAYYHENGRIQSVCTVSIHLSPTNALLAVPVADEQEISSIPAGYETVAGDTYYDYYYHVQNPSAQKKIVLFNTNFKYPESGDFEIGKEHCHHFLSARKNSLKCIHRRFLPSNCPLLRLPIMAKPLHRLLR